MKLFAKRKRKAVEVESNGHKVAAIDDPASNATTSVVARGKEQRHSAKNAAIVRVVAQQDQSHASESLALSNKDKIISSTESATSPPLEDLLRQEPATWNSKQRRMIKRYQERHGDESTATVAAAPATEAKAHRTSSKLADESCAGIYNDPPQHDNNDNHNDNDQEMHDLLNQLNSKQRRTMMRKYQHCRPDNCNDNNESRESIRQQILVEARQILNQLKPIASAAVSLPSLADHPATTTKKQSFKVQVDSCNKDEMEDAVIRPPSEPAHPILTQRSKRRRVSVNLATLPPNERLRREEQRQKQREAAEQRQKQQALAMQQPQALVQQNLQQQQQQQHRHPLNSERRRANRRKPKWKPPSSKSRTSSTLP